MKLYSAKNSLIWKRRIAKFYSIFFNPNDHRKIILIYHAIGNSPWAISKNHFRQQIQWLKENAQIVSLTRLLTTSPKKNTLEVALTFDDGYACLYDTVAPILEAEHAAATVYVNSGLVGENTITRQASREDLGHYPNEHFLIWDEIKKLDQQGWEIASHGVNHLDLTQCDHSVVKNELILSKKMIEYQLQKQCNHFAYTWGKHTQTLRRAVKEAGYDYAVAGHHAPFKDTNNLLALPRLHIGKEYTLTDFAHVVTGKWDFVGKIQCVKKWTRKKY